MYSLPSTYRCRCHAQHLSLVVLKALLIVDVGSLIYNGNLNSVCLMIPTPVELPYIAVFVLHSILLYLFSVIDRVIDVMNLQSNFKFLHEEWRTDMMTVLELLVHDATEAKVNVQERTLIDRIGSYDCVN